MLPAAMTAVTCIGILGDHREEWERALQHSFLQSCRDGSLTPEAFNTWLIQDRIFVMELIKFSEHIVACAPEADVALLRGGVRALKDEVTWMQGHINSRQLDGDVMRHDVTARYIQMLHDVRLEPYPVLITALWAIEYVYNEGWASLGEVAQQFQEFQQRWGSQAFSDYVAKLERQADCALAAAPQEQRERAVQVAGKEVPHLEFQFWQMALNPSGS